MNGLKVGFGRINITPMMGIPLMGYYQVRLANGVLDDLEANAIAYELDDKPTIMISVDHCGLKRVLLDQYRAKIKRMDVPTNKATKEQLPEVHRINDLYVAGRANELPYEGMMLTTVVAEAARMVRLENEPETYEMLLSGMRIGPVIFVGIPGEPFTNVGRGLKESTEFDLVIPIKQVGRIYHCTG